MTLQQFWTNLDTMPDLALLARLAVLMLALAAFCAVVWFGGKMLGHPRRGR